MQILSIILLAVIIILLILILFKKHTTDLTPIETALKSTKEQLSAGIDRNDKTLRDELQRNREEAGNQSKISREESANSLKGFTDSTTLKLNQLTQSVDQKMKEMREGNDLKLDQMRDIVDKKLHETLERRLGESFKLVSDKIESVTKGINDVQNIVASVGDLKKVIANPKTKGVLGEYQLQMLIKDILIEGQYVENLGLKKTTNEDGRVEFAVKLPGEHKGAPVYLPIDAKYPTTEYDKLIEAFNTGDKAAVDRAQAALESKIMSMAKDVSEYVTPPITADFAVMFLPFESLFAEVIRRPGLFERLKREHKVIITGPTTLAALLNALQVGFATLAVQQNASEMKELLVAVKADFDKFGNLLADTHEKLVTAAESIDDASKKTRTINNKLKKVEEIELE